MKINKIKNTKHLANIEATNTEYLKVNFAKDKPKGKITILETVNDEITNVFETSNFNPSFYENGGVLRNGSPSDSNYAKYKLAKKDIDNGKKVKLFESKQSKKEILRLVKKNDNKYPSKNFQSNKENIPADIKKELNVIKDDRLKKDKVKVKNEHAEIQKNAQSRAKKIVRKGAKM